jgi:hypothetical protein
MLDTPNLGLCRGSGGLVLLGGQWKIAQHNLSVPIPNALVHGIVRRLARAELRCIFFVGRTTRPRRTPWSGSGILPYGITKKPVSTRSSAMRFHITRALPSAMACWKATSCPVCSAA